MSKALETQAWNCNEWPRELSDQVVAYAILAERERCVKAVKESMMLHYMSIGTGNSAIAKIMGAEE